MSKRHIRIDLGNGAWARVSPDIQPETVAALRRMLELARRHLGGPRIARLIDGEDPTGDSPPPDS